MRLSGKVIVVTGAGNGIGREVTLELLRRGANVAAVDRSSNGLAETAEMAAAAPAGSLTLHPVDITDREQVEALAEAVVKEQGQVDAVANIAGIIQPFVPINDLSHADIDRVMAVNFGGTVNTVKAFLPLLMARPEAALLNVSSMGAIVPVPGQGAYGASKAAVALLTETLFAELQDSPVAVTLVYPGATRTNIAANSGVTMDLGQGADAPAMPMTPASEAARVIVDALESGEPRVLIGRDTRMLDRMSRLMPTRAITIVARRMKALLAG